MSERPSVADLCTASLKEKWNHDSDAEIGDLCPFCRDAESVIGPQPTDEPWSKYLGRMCEVCQCPEEICCKEGNGGIVGDLPDEDEDGGDIWKVSDLPSDELDAVIDAFVRHGGKVE